MTARDIAIAIVVVVLLIVCIAAYAYYFASPPGSIPPIAPKTLAYVLS